MCCNGTKNCNLTFNFFLYARIVTKAVVVYYALSHAVSNQACLEFNAKPDMGRHM